MAQRGQGAGQAPDDWGLGPAVRASCRWASPRSPRRPVARPTSQGPQLRLSSECKACGMLAAWNTEKWLD